MLKSATANAAGFPAALVTALENLLKSTPTE
jgi:hypothetical protein